MRVRVASPLLPREWICAHGLEPLAEAPCPRARAVPVGVCSFARAWEIGRIGPIGPIREPALKGEVADAALFASSCDQMRRAADAALADGKRVFLMNAPATWQSPGAKRMYRQEVERLGRFLVSLGGKSPEPETLAAEMRRHETARAKLLALRGRLSNRQFAEAAARYGARDLEDSSDLSDLSDLSDHPRFIPLAFVGESLLARHLVLLDWLQSGGGRVVLNAAVEPSLEMRFGDGQPFEALVDAYFAQIPSVFQRPNFRLYDWLRPRLRSRGARGIVLFQYAWCDLWRAEANRLREEFNLPVLLLDAGDAVSVPESLRTRIETFLEMLRG